MPAELLDGQAGISCLFSDGRRYRRVVAAEPAALVRDMLAGLVALVHPHGSVDSPGTVIQYVQGILDIARFMRERGADGGAAQLSRGLLAEYWMQAGGIHEPVTRRMLASFDAASGGDALQAGARELAAGRRFKAKPSSSPLIPYTEEEWARLHQACRDDVDQAFARHRQALKLAACGQDPRDGGWTPASKRWLLMRTGPPSDVQAGKYLGRSATWVARRGGGIRAASEELFPGVNVVVAYRLLLGIYTGTVPDGIAGLGIGDIDWAGDAWIRTTYLSLRDRSRWHGSSRSAIDPNHSPAVEGDHYLTAATPAQRDALDTIIEDAQHDLLKITDVPSRACATCPSQQLPTGVIAGR